MLTLRDMTYDLERRLMPQYCAQRDIQTLIDADPELFWQAFFGMIQLARGICPSCQRPGQIRRIEGLRELLVSTCDHCRAFWLLLVNIDVPAGFADRYPEEDLSVIENWRVVQPLNVFIACNTALLATDAEEETWLEDVLQNAIDSPHHRQKLIDRIVEKENHVEK